MNIRSKECEIVDKFWNEYRYVSNSVNNEGYGSKGEDDIYTTFVEKDAVEEEEPTSYNLTEEELEEIEELMIEALGLEDGPKLESEIDLMEWFAEMDEDDWSDLTEYTSDTDDDTGCGQAVYDVYGSDGPRERGEEELMSPPPNIPNGGTGGSGDDGDDGGDGDITPGEDCPCAGYYDYESCLFYHDTYGILDGAFEDDEVYSYCNKVCYQTCMIETPVGCEEVCGAIGGELCLYTTIGYPFCLQGLDEHGCPWLCDQLGY